LKLLKKRRKRRCHMRMTKRVSRGVLFREMFKRLPFIHWTESHGFLHPKITLTKQRGNLKQTMELHVKERQNGMKQTGINIEILKTRTHPEFELLNKKRHSKDT
jgi:hypothetical protein